MIGTLTGIIGCLPRDWWRCLHEGQEQSDKQEPHGGIIVAGSANHSLSEWIRSTLDAALNGKRQWEKQIRTLRTREKIKIRTLRTVGCGTRYWLGLDLYLRGSLVVL